MLHQDFILRFGLGRHPRGDPSDGRRCACASLRWGAAEPGPHGMRSGAASISARANASALSNGRALEGHTLGAAQLDRRGREVTKWIVATERPVPQETGASLVIDGNAAVDDDERNASRELSRVVVGRVVVDSLGVEHDQVGQAAPSRYAHPSEAKASSGGVRHPLHHLLERQGTEGPAETTQEPGERAIAAGVREAAGGRDVAADHVVGARQQLHVVTAELSPDCGALRRRREVADAQVIPPGAKRRESRPSTAPAGRRCRAGSSPRGAGSRAGR